MTGIKQELALKQKQTLTPQQILTIKLIELPYQEMEQRIRKEIEENPVLEEDQVVPKEVEEPASLSRSDDDSIPHYKLFVNNRGKDEEQPRDTTAVIESFSESLTRQLGFCNIDPESKKIAEHIIFSLDANGYLRRSIDKIVDDLAFRAQINTTEEKVEQMLKLIQTFDPAGIGARDLQECLLLQLRAKKPSENVKNAILIIDGYFKEFSSKHYAKILSKLGITEEEFKQARSVITKLNPLPGGGSSTQYEDKASRIVPDFVLKNEDGRLEILMPKSRIPELRVKKEYIELANSGTTSTKRSEKEAAAFAKKKIDSAKFFVESLRQRNNTLKKTMEAIVDFQRDYFEDGNVELLRPMVLRDIAEKTGFDISTISRVANSKYIETEYGIKPLKFFFSEGMENSEGEEVSTRAQKQALQDIIDSEDKRHPFTDEQLVIEMEKKGYKLARRTVAKYREQLKIPRATLRKDL